jgi:hypothetical protein
VGLGDLPFLVDHVRDAARIFVLRRVGGAVREADLVLGVAEQREREVELLGEAAILLDRVETDADDLCVLRFVLEVEVPEPGTLTRSTGGVGLWVEPEDDFLAAQVGELHTVALVIDGVEVGSGIAYVQHLWFSSRECAKDSAEGHAAIVVVEPSSRRVDERILSTT